MADTLKNLKYMQITGQEKYGIGLDKVSHFPDMNIQDDSTLYAKLLAKKRSTFDRSKFEVVGSPNITNDGIASGFSSSNYLQVNNIPIQAFDVEYEFNLGDFQPTTASDLFNFSYPYKLYFNENSNLITMSYYDSNNTIKYVGLGSISVNTTYKLSLHIENGNFKSKLTDLNTLIEKSQTFNDFYTNYTNLTSIRLFNGYSGSIDLKQFSITIYGVEVFNGNKTGVDQIKKDDYTIFPSSGSNVVISNEGIASNFSNGGVYAIKFEPGNKSWRVEERLYYIDNGTTTQKNHLYNEFADRGLGSWLGRNNVGVNFSLADDGLVQLNKYNLNFKDGDIVDFIYSYEASTQMYSFKVFQNGLQVADESKVGTDVLRQSDAKRIILGRRSNTNYSTCEIDLNYFKIFIEDELVYQPTLRIPYTQSKTGAKIVDSTYRERVEDMYEQFGYTHYYTIGDEPEKYNVEVVGSPTLVGGVASGFSNSNYIDILCSIDTTKAWEVSLKIKLFDSRETNQYIHGYGFGTSNVSRFCSRVGIRQDNILFIDIADTATSWKIGVNAGTTTLINNKDYYIKYGWDKTNYYLLLSEDGINYATEISFNNSSPVYIINEQNHRFGNTGTFNDIRHAFNSGSTDLSQFSIKVDGKEVFRGYEPKVVDAYTLATHKNCDVIDSYYGTDGVTSYELTADLQQTVTGGGMAAQTVTLAKPFKDNKYICTKETSAKTATTLTLSENGTFIAKGLGVLG